MIIPGGSQRQSAKEAELSTWAAVELFIRVTELFIGFHQNLARRTGTTTSSSPSMFFHEFLQNWIADNMEDPKKRDEKGYAYVRHQLAAADKL